MERIDIVGTVLIIVGVVSLAVAATLHAYEHGQPVTVLCHAGTERNIHDEAPLYPAWEYPCWDNNGRAITVTIVD